MQLLTTVIQTFREEWRKTSSKAPDGMVWTARCKECEQEEPFTRRDGAKGWTFPHRVRGHATTIELSMEDGESEK